MDSYTETTISNSHSIIYVDKTKSKEQILDQSFKDFHYVNFLSLYTPRYELYMGSPSLLYDDKVNKFFIAFDYEGISSKEKLDKVIDIYIEQSKSENFALPYYSYVEWEEIVDSFKKNKNVKQIVELFQLPSEGSIDGESECKGTEERKI